jgi:hypothetical protein
MAPQRLSVEHIFCGKSSSCRRLFLRMEGEGGWREVRGWRGEGRGDEGYFVHFFVAYAYAHLHQLSLQLALLHSQIAPSSNCHTLKLSHSQIVTNSNYHVLKLAYSQIAPFLNYPILELPHSQIVTLSNCHIL